jgi:tight adherence protein B
MAIIVALLAFLAIAAIGVAFTGSSDGGKAAKRAKEIASGRSPRTRKDAVADAAAKRRASVQANLKDLVNKEQARKRNLISVKGRLAQADLAWSEPMFWMVSAGLAFVFGGGVFVASGGNPLWGGAVTVIMGLGLPRWTLGFLTARRQKQFSNQLADALDIIVRGVKSGLPLNQCLHVIASEAPKPLCTEFKHIVDGQAMGVSLEQNLSRLYERVPLPEVNFFMIVLVIQQKTGGNLSESLGNLSTVLRSRKLMREKVKALSSEAKASAMIIGALPFIVMAMVQVVRPDYLSILFTSPQGNLILLGSATMMGAGIFTMRSMINFKF